MGEGEGEGEGGESDMDVVDAITCYILHIDCLLLACRLPLIRICSAIVGMGPGPWPKKGAVLAAVGAPFLGLGPGPYSLWLSICA